MKTIFNGNLEAATERIVKLKARGIYACLSGCKGTGYEVLVRDAVAGTANENGQIQHAGGNA